MLKNNSSLWTLISPKSCHGESIFNEPWEHQHVYPFCSHKGDRFNSQDRCTVLLLIPTSIFHYPSFFQPLVSFFSFFENELFLNSCLFSQLHFIERESASLVFCADGDWIAGYGFVNMWHTTGHTHADRQSFRGKLPPSFTVETCNNLASRSNTVQVLTGMYERHVCTVPVKQVFTTSFKHEAYACHLHHLFHYLLLSLDFVFF